MPRLALPTALLATIAVVVPASGAAAAPTKPGYAPGEVIVATKGASASAADGSTGSKVVKLRKGTTVKEAVARLRRDPDVAYAVPNYKAKLSATVPNDPGYRRQWNLKGGFGLNMPDAWDLAKQASASGGAGAVVAVVDTGVAYENYGRFRRNPDLGRFVKGYDFVDGDSHPNDENGHGTHVAGTIAQSTGNRMGAAGIAYRARIMPVRVLDERGDGDSIAIARGIRYAARRGADVINISFEFRSFITNADIPEVLSALRYAHRKGATIVGAAGNAANSAVAYPAKAPDVISVAASTANGCLADYSNSGAGTDVTAPGGGDDAPLTDTPYDAANCKPGEKGPLVYQETFTSSVRTFGLVGEMGTSMAAPHVSGVAAMLIATKRVRNSPEAVEQRLETTARDVGAPGVDRRYGHGLLNAQAALAR